MASSNDVVADAPSTDNQEQVTKEEKPTKTNKDKKTTTTSKDKKPKATKPTASHPPYTQMITEAIGALKERTGSSPHAIAKFLSEKYKSDLPPTFKKHINVQLKNMIKLGKVVKVKGSFKLPKPAGSSTGSTKPKKAPTARKAPAAKAPAKDKTAKPAGKAPAKETKAAAPAAKKAEKPAPKKASMTKKAPAAKKTTATKKSAPAPKKAPAAAKKVAAPKKAGSVKKS